MGNNNNDYTRRDFLKFTGAGTLSLATVGSIFGQTSNSQNSKEIMLYVGTYTSGKTPSDGIYLYKFNQNSGELAYYKSVKNVVEPSYLTLDKNRRYLYAVNETVEYKGQKSGAVSAFAIDRKTGDLTFLNKQPSMGGAPCYVIISRDEKFVLVANYVGGNAAVFPITKNGSLGASIDLKQNTGAGPNKDRQEAAHAHSITLNKQNHFAYLCDLGLDKIFIYEFNKKTGKLTANPAQEYFQAKPGAGPRHFTFHQNGKIAYVINELASSITTLAYDQKTGTLKEIETVTALPSDWSGENTCADLHISPNGTFLYGSNRGHNSIVSYKIDVQTGKLSLIGHTSTGGKTPRNFTIEPNGKFLLAANQNSDSVVVFSIDETSGKLSPTGKIAQIPSPVCLKFV